MTYRVFIGGWDEGEDPDWINVDHRGLTWDLARYEMAEHLKKYADDSREHCREEAADELARLNAATEGKFETTVDVDDYLILPET